MTKKRLENLQKVVIGQQENAREPLRLRVWAWSRRPSVGRLVRRGRVSHEEGLWPSMRG